MKSTLIWAAITSHERMAEINVGCTEAFRETQSELPELLSPADALLFQLAWKKAVNWTLKNMQKELERTA